MTDKLAIATPLIAKLLRLVLSASTPDGEWQNAFTKLMAALQEADPGGHEITKRIEAPPISEEVIKEKIKDEAKKIFEAGRAKGREEEIESRQRGMAIVASLANIGGGGGVNGYSWREIVEHCLINRYRIYNVWERDFIKSVAGQLASTHSSLTPKQTPIVARIFQQWFNGRM
jgi:hypothetical protein